MEYETMSLGEFFAELMTSLSFAIGIIITGWIVYAVLSLIRGW